MRGAIRHIMATSMSSQFTLLGKEDGDDNPGLPFVSSPIYDCIIGI